ncbi:MAG TPA: VWA domain-containing protein [Myxococcota bacterium]|nr:VWA domain-containing protein [Myxococcota bacterium]HRY93155.1 VWA domain-containing protein [Myxococcota bacterium]HSA21918.1 VWA domain-containing protein [Myxococcota bacterium]
MSEQIKPCDAFAEDLVALVDGELEAERRAELEAHLSGCPACQAVVAELRQLGERMQAWRPEEPRTAWEREAAERVRAEAERRKLARAERRRGQGGVWGWIGRPAFALAAASCLLLLVAGAVFSDPIRRLFGTNANALAGREDARPPKKLHGHRAMKDFAEVGRDFPGGPRSFAPPADAPARQGWDAGPVWHDPPSLGGMPVQPEPLVGVRAGIERLPGPEALDRAALPDPVAPPPEARANPNAYYDSGYQPGAGDRERVEKLIAAGVLVDGKQLKLGTFTRSYHQTLAVPGRTALGLEALLDQARLPPEGGEVFLQVAIQGQKRETGRRPPLHVALVIDRSGSMGEGDRGATKLQSAQRAALRFVDGLREDDVLTVVSYDHEVEVLSSASGASRSTLRRFIRDLYPRGNTNIHDALDRAYRELARQSRPELVNAVILLSDGLPTAGPIEPAPIVALSRVAADNHITTTTVGVGLDYNDQLMMDLARRGQGHYHFVKDAASIEPIFETELESLDRVVARALRLRIVLADGVVLKRVLGSKELGAGEVAEARREETDLDRRLEQELGIKTDRARDDEGGVKMLIPYFFGGDSHVVMLQLWVPPGAQRKRVAEVTLKYKDLLYARNGADEREVVVGYSASPDEVVASISRPVKKNLLGFRAGEALLTASELVGRGDARRAARMLEEQAEIFSRAAEAWGDEELRRDGLLLGEYRGLLRSLEDPALAGAEELRAYLAKTLSHSGYKLVQ